MSKLNGVSFWWDTSAERMCFHHTLFNVAHLSGSPGQPCIVCCCCSSPSALVSLGHEETSANWPKLHPGHPKQLSPCNPFILIFEFFQSGLWDTPEVVPNRGAAWGYLILFPAAVNFALLEVTSQGGVGLSKQLWLSGEAWGKRQSASYSFLGA